MGLRNIKLCSVVIASALSCASLVDVSCKASAGIIPYSGIGPHEYQFPVSGDMPRKEDAKLKAQVLALLEHHDTAFSAHDLRGVMKTYMSGSEILLMGTAPGEVYRGKEGVEEAYSEYFTNFDKGALSFNYNRVFAGSKHDIAWFAAEGTVKIKVKDELKVIGFNLSGTLSKQKGEWRFITRHFSLQNSTTKHEEEI